MHQWMFILKQPEMTTTPLILQNRPALPPFLHRAHPVHPSPSLHWPASSPLPFDCRSSFSARSSRRVNSQTESIAGPGKSRSMYNRRCRLSATAGSIRHSRSFTKRAGWRAWCCCRLTSRDQRSISRIVRLDVSKSTCRINGSAVQSISLYLSCRDSCPAYSLLHRHCPFPSPFRSPLHRIV